METKPPSKVPLLASVVVIAILAIGLGYFYVTSSQKESAMNSTISSQQSVIGAQSQSIQSQSASINTLQGSVSTLQANTSAYRTLVASLNSMLAMDKAQLATLSANLQKDNATIATLKSQISLMTSELTNYTNIITLQNSKTLVSSQSVTVYGTTHHSSTPFVTFAPNYAGFVLISVSSASSFFLNSTAKPSNLNPNGAVYEVWSFLAPSSPTGVSYMVMPVSPGTVDSFALLTNSAVDGTATVTATYYY